MTMDRHDRTLWVDGTSMTYTLAGDRGRPPICFIPGWCGSRSFFAAQIDHFARENLVIAVDFPGFGDSRLAPGLLDGDYTMSHPSKLVRRVLAEEGVGDCCLVGHSAGGALALDVAAENPGLAWGVIGIDALTNTLFYPRQEESVVDGIVGPLEADFAEVASAVAETWFIEGTDPAFKRGIIETALAADKATATATLRAFLRWDMMRRLDTYKGFVGAIVAADFYDTPDASSPLRHKLSVQPLSGVGHFLMMERPEQFNETMERFLLGSGKRP